MPAAFPEQSAGQLHPLLCGCCPEGIFTLISIAYFSEKILLFPKDIPKKDRRMDFHAVVFLKDAVSLCRSLPLRLPCSF